MLSPHVEDILIQLGINIVLALSLYFPFSAGQLSLGQGGFMAIGAYASSWLGVALGWPWPATFAAAALSAAVIGGLVGLPALRVRGIYLVLMTLGFGEIVRVFFLNFEPTGAAQGYRGMAFVTDLPLVAAIVVAVSVLAGRTAGSPLGRAFAAIGTDELAAEVIGIDVTRAKLVAFVVGAAVAGLAGALWAHYVLFIDPEEFGFHRSVMPFTFLVVGGMQTYWGPLVGATVLTVLPEYLRFLQEWRLAFLGGAMILVMIVRPQGLVDRRLIDALGRALRYLLPQPARGPAG
ncbi:MAG TPA: branched-chain amino acid ABC transporter permease [Methylomirabilota bacterium]|nr:branched-chain amino acid ABC transporter permease [Methylomirabilota bacterium]